MNVKHWLIRKLGGYTDPPFIHSPNTIIQYQQPVVQLHAERPVYHISPIGPNEHKYFSEMLALDLARKIVEDELMDITVDSESPLSKRYRATITIVPPVRHDKFEGEQQCTPSKNS